MFRRTKSEPRRTITGMVLRKLATSNSSAKEEDGYVLCALEAIQSAFVPYKRIAVRIVLSSILMTLFGVVSMNALKRHMEVDSSWEKVVFFALFIVCFLLGHRSFFYYWVFRERDILKIAVSKELRDKITNRLRSVHSDALESYIHRQGLPSSVLEDVSSSFSLDVAIVVKDVFMFLINLVAIAWFLSWEYAVLMIGACYLMVRLQRFSYRLNQEVSRKSNKLESEGLTDFEEWLLNSRLFADRGLTRVEARRLSDLSDRQILLYKQNKWRLVGLASGSSMVGLSMVVPAMLYALLVRGAGPMDVILLAVYFGDGLNGLSSAVNFVLKIADKWGALKKFGELLSLPDRPYGENKLPKFEELRVEGLRIQFGDRVLFPGGLNLEISAGPPGAVRKYAVVGESGSGKSSLVGVLIRRLENGFGDTSWSGKCLYWTGTKWGSVEKLDLDSFPRAVVSTAQATEKLSARSGFDNIELALMESSLNEVNKREIDHQLAEKLLLDPKVLDNPCGHLSGGEQKRVQIASALAILQKRILEKEGPVLLVLDEALSQLDQPTARRVLAVIEEMMQVVGGAILQIAHSEYAISEGSRIIVLGPDGSGIVEKGELEVLANNPKSRFRQLFPKS